MHTFGIAGRVARLMSLGAVALALGTATGCENFLTAENPGAVEADDLNDAVYANLIAGGAIFGFQDANDDVTYWNGQLTDELFNRAVFVEEGQIDRRELYSDMTYINAFLYAPMQRARFLSEDAVRRLTTILGDTTGRDLRVARALAYGGYTYITLGEMMCTTPIDRSVPKTWDEMMTASVAKFDSAVTIATAAKAYLQTVTPVTAAITAAIAGADSVKNFALVGAARASLDKNDKAKALVYANQVPADFVFRAYYSVNTAGQSNRTWDRLTNGKNANLLNTPFAAMTTDPRVPRIAGTTGNGGTPLSPPSYSTFSNTLAGADFAATSSMRIASGLEAQYIIAEANGPTAATLAFVNTRRAAGQQTPTAVTGDALMAELRDQRSRDFYLDNHRLGDLRRYKRFYQVDLWPKGPYPGSTSGAIYNEAIDCWPLPTNEINDNPNIPR
ncbi:MAG TPA: RagB/SusD family nutrient uptake outer membrane protein [Gemmatimonadaceae bacterium]|nr:RagB/SusD family nutrient uptake outer membrane protein [Gemmatimonadaceae bacterium]